MTVGEIIRQKRTERGWSQRKLADKCGVSTLSVWGWENDQFFPTLIFLICLADTFGITLDELVGRSRR